MYKISNDFCITFVTSSLLWQGKQLRTLPSQCDRGFIVNEMSLVVRKQALCKCEKTKMQISCAVTAQLISAFVFATWLVQSLYYLNPKFQASSHLLWLYSPVCVVPGRKPRRPVFSQGGSNISILFLASKGFSSSELFIFTAP